FTIFTSGNHPGLGSDRVKALAEDAAGRVWIGTENGLARYEHGAFVTYTKRDGLPDDMVVGLAVTRTGIVWIATAGGGLARLDAAGIHTVVAPATTFGAVIYNIVADTSGAAWL